MNSGSALSQPSALRATVAYLLAAAAGVTLILGSTFPGVIAGRASSGLLYPLTQTLGVLLSDCVAIIVLWFPVAFVFALPCVLLNIFAARFRIRSLLFYIPAGCILALAGAALLVHMTRGWTWYTNPPDSPPPLGFRAELHRIAPVFSVAGAMAGFIYWFVAGRHFRGKPLQA